MTTKEKLQSLAQNSIVLDISEELEDYAPCSTHFGGRPDVPADFAWPRYQGKGYNYECPERPLTFLAQFNCADFAAMDSDHLLPDYGLLSFFYEMDSEPWGFSPEDKGGLKVYWFEDLSTLVQAEFPEETDDEAFESVREELGLEESEESSKLLGWPDIIQNSMYKDCELVTRGYYLGNPEGYAKITPEDKEASKAAIDQWQMIFQLDSTVETDDFELMFGDCGRLYVFVRKEDLVARNFENAWGKVQCF